MKKKTMIFLGTTIIVAAFGFLIFAMVSEGMTNAAKDKTLISISFNELQKKIEKKDTFILVLTQKQCSHCAEYKPVLKEVLYEYDLKAYELDQKTLTKTEKAKLKDIASITGTPTTVFISEGSEIATATRIHGAASKGTIISRFKAMGYITNE
jgi:predicted bacteriocin transport accessory protein